MSPRTGRPPVDGETKGTRITFRATEADLHKILYCCKRSGYSKSQIIRLGVETLYDQTLGMPKKKENKKQKTEPSKE